MIALMCIFKCVLEQRPREARPDLASVFIAKQTATSFEQQRQLLPSEHIDNSTL